jgi:hypothetical protein
LARFPLCFGQLGFLVEELSLQVLLGAGQGLHVAAKCFKGSFGGFRCVFLRLQQLSVPLLRGSQSPLQLRHSILK